MIFKEKEHQHFLEILRRKSNSLSLLQNHQNEPQDNLHLRIKKTILINNDHNNLQYLMKKILRYRWLQV